MNLQDHLTIAGRLTLRRYALDGTLVEEVRGHNDITLAGRELVARLFNRDLADTRISRISTMVVGSDDHPFNPQDKELGNRVDAVPISKIEDVSVTDKDGRPRMMLRLVGELGEKQGNGELREAGLFTDDEKVMYNRVVFKPVNKSPEFKLTLVWEITF